MCPVCHREMYSEKVHLLGFCGRCNLSAETDFAFFMFELNEYRLKYDRFLAYCERRAVIVG